MRWPIGAALLIVAAPSLADRAPVPPMDLHVDVPGDKGPQEANVLIREFPVGGSSGWHVHPGVEIAYLLEGEMTLEQKGEPLRRLRPGESFVMPRGVAHNGTNVGTVPARLVITYLVDKGAPLRSPVP